MLHVGHPLNINTRVSSEEMFLVWGIVTCSVSMFINVVLIFYSTCSTEKSFDSSVILFLSTQIYLFKGDKSF